MPTNTVEHNIVVSVMFACWHSCYQSTLQDRETKFPVADPGIERKRAREWERERDTKTHVKTKDLAIRHKSLLAFLFLSINRFNLLIIDCRLIIISCYCWYWAIIVYCFNDLLLLLLLLFLNCSISIKCVRFGFFLHIIYKNLLSTPQPNRIPHFFTRRLFF